jgi:hypothetical protein
LVPTRCPNKHTLPISLWTTPRPSPSSTRLRHLCLHGGLPGSDSSAREFALALPVSLEHSQRMTLLLISLLYSCQLFSAPQWRMGIAPRSCDTLRSCAWCRLRQCACPVVAARHLLFSRTRLPSIRDALRVMRRSGKLALRFGVVCARLDAVCVVWSCRKCRKWAWPWTRRCSRTNVAQNDAPLYSVCVQYDVGRIIRYTLCRSRHAAPRTLVEYST